MISCVIHTYNSELYLDQVLDSVRFCDEIVIVDMYSSDSSLDIAKRHNAKIYFHENLGYADPARQFGVDCCSYDWILSVDSDEIIPHELGIKLKELATSKEFDVVSISRRNFMFGREILGSGWGYKSDVIPRFFKKNSLVYGDEVHNFINVASDSSKTSIVSRDLSIIHFNYDSISQYISKLNRYTDFEIRKNNSNLSPLILIIYYFIREVFGRFFILKGYRDGWLGLYLAISMAFYRATTVAKKHLPSSLEVIAMNRNICRDLNED